MWRALAPILVAGCGRLEFDVRVDALSVDAAPPRGLATACGFSSLTVLHDGIPADDSAGDRMQSAIAQQCANGQAQRAVSQDAPGILDPTTYRPLLAASDLAVVGGGDAYQHANVYFVAQSSWPIDYVEDTTSFTWTERATGTVVLQAPYSSLTATHDYGLVVIIRDTVGGATMVTGFGPSAPGTLAAAYLFETIVAPAIRSDSHAWYAVEWTNGDADANPTPGDTLTMLGSGY